VQNKLENHTFQLVIKKYNSARTCLAGEEACMDSIPLLPLLISGFVPPHKRATTINQNAMAAKYQTDYVYVMTSLSSVPLFCLFTLSPQNKLSSAKCLVCFNFQSASMSLKFGYFFVLVTNSLDLDETPSYSASHLDPSC